MALSPVEQCGFKKTTSYNDLIEYVEKISGDFPYIEVKNIGKSVQNREIQLIHVAPAQKGNNIKVLLICQQHGNEPAGKEMALMLLNKIAKGMKKKILSGIDLYIIPMANPDGNEAGKRVNANGEDLNRNHLILTQPEVLAIHNVYNDVDPDVTLDVHEYSAFRKEFRSAGFVRSDDEEFGAPTNTNISPEIRNFALLEMFPFLKMELAKQGISFSNYYKLNSPDDTVRASTTSIDDGRQSFALQGTFSFLLEGRGGDKMNEDLQRRTTRELAAVEKFLEFVNLHAEKIKLLVKNEKIKLKESSSPVPLNMNYVCDGSRIDMPMQMLDSGADTMMSLPFASEVKVLDSAIRPQAYVIPKSIHKVIDFLDRNRIQYIKTKKPYDLSVDIYTILNKRRIWMENKSFSLPITNLRNETIQMEPGDIIVPLNQRAGVMLVIALEPNSMWGLSQYDEFDFLCNKGSDYPIFRVPIQNKR
jgi:hypothetical protein